MVDEMQSPGICILLSSHFWSDADLIFKRDARKDGEVNYLALLQLQQLSSLSVTEAPKSPI